MPLVNFRTSQYWWPCVAVSCAMQTTRLNLISGGLCSKCFVFVCFFIFLSTSWIIPFCKNVEKLYTSTLGGSLSIISERCITVILTASAALELLHNYPALSPLPTVALHLQGKLYQSMKYFYVDTVFLIFKSGSRAWREDELKTVFRCGPVSNTRCTSSVQHVMEVAYKRSSLVCQN